MQRQNLGGAFKCEDKKFENFFGKEALNPSSFIEEIVLYIRQPPNTIGNFFSKCFSVLGLYTQEPLLLAPLNALPSFESGGAPCFCHVILQRLFWKWVLLVHRYYLERSDTIIVPWHFQY
jgi:hypothetical protein